MLKSTFRSKYLNLNQQINIDIKQTDIKPGDLVPPAEEMELKPNPINYRMEDDKAVLTQPDVETLKEPTKTPRLAVVDIPDMVIPGLVILPECL